MVIGKKYKRKKTNSKNEREGTCVLIASNGSVILYPEGDVEYIPFNHPQAELFSLVKKVELVNK